MQFIILQYTIYNLQYTILQLTTYILQFGMPVEFYY